MSLMPAPVPVSTQHPLVRCAVYARLSSNEDPGQSFGSIEAQTQACVAYITSQRGMGWQAMERHYADTDISGTVLQRPGLQRLMTDIEAGKVAMVVVHKLDRLSRSVQDFTQLMAFFDQHQVALVSVTQHLNSQNSMGRLAINTLMSFAEFEHDLISERRRDKMAATRRKGLWVGSVPPLGYVQQGQRLVVEPNEAKQVQQIFERFVALGSMVALVQELTEQGATTKAWVTRTGKTRGGRAIDKTYIYKLLNNRLLIGQLQIDEAWQPAAHAPIISDELWEQAQALLGERRRPRKRPPSPHTADDDSFLLRGLIFGEDGRAYSPWTSSLRRNRLYRYYVPQKDIALGGGTSGLPRLNAFTVEEIVVQHVHEQLQSPAGVLSQLPDWMLAHPEYDEQEFASALTTIAEVWELLFPHFKERIVKQVLERVTVHPNEISVRLRVDGFVALVRAHLEGETLQLTIREMLNRPPPKKSPKTTR